MVIFMILAAAVASGGGCPTGMLAVSVAGGVEERGRLASPYCLDRTEVTVADYLLCVGTGDCTPPGGQVRVPDIPSKDLSLWSRSCNGPHSERSQHPVNCVDSGQAEAYCAAVGKRLPTEAEWQWAATGGEESRRFPWGESKPSKTLLNACDFDCLDRLRAFGQARPTLHYGEDGFAETAPVGSFPDGAGRWGHLDLAGNVWEFTATPYSADGSVRVMRGGGWLQSNREMVESGYRGGFPASARGSVVGFRCADDL